LLLQVLLQFSAKFPILFDKLAESTVYKQVYKQDHDSQVQQPKCWRKMRNKRACAIAACLSETHSQ